jgi:hypothetical protein
MQDRQRESRSGGGVGPSIYRALRLVYSLATRRKRRRMAHSAARLVRDVAFNHHPPLVEVAKKAR